MKLKICAFVLLLASFPAAQTKRTMTPDDVLAVKAIAAVKISPDGKLVLYELAYSDLKENQTRNEIWLASGTGLATFKPRRFTSGQEDRSPEWSQDGQSVAFLSTRGAATAAGEAAHAQVYV